MALPAGSPGRVGTRSNTEIGKDCAVACTVVVLRVRPRLCGATVSAPPSTAAHVISNLCVTVIAPLFALRCECALRSFEIAELLLLFGRSEEHTSELQSRGHLVCRLLLEKK